MINPARIVAANLRVDYIAVFQPKVESVWTVLVVGSGFPGDAFAFVLDDAPAFWNELHGVNATTVHTGLANFEPYSSMSSFPPCRHMQCESIVVCELLVATWLVLFFDCAADFSQVFPKCVTRIGCPFLQVVCELQLFAQ